MNINPPWGVHTLEAHVKNGRKTKQSRSRRQVILPRGFPSHGDRPSAGRGRSWSDRFSAPLGAGLLHGLLIWTLIQFPVLRQVFGDTASEDLEWVWLPEVAYVPPSAVPEPPPPPPEPPPVAVESTDPVPPEPEPPPPPPEPSVAELTPPEPVSAPAPEIFTAAPGEPAAWSEVRTNVIQALRYPARARRQGIEGVATLALQADGDGCILHAEIRPPAPHPALAAAALAAARGLGPFPALGAAIRAGAVPAAAEIPVRFELARPGPTAKGPNGRERGKTAILRP